MSDQPQGRLSATVYRPADRPAPRPDPLTSTRIRVCPECAGGLARAGGCLHCPHCGWGRCA